MPISSHRPDHVPVAHAVRASARFEAAFDARTEVPPTDLSPRGGDRSQPYLYSPAHDAAGGGPMFPSPLRAATTEAFTVLMAATGTCTGEVMGLDRGDVDLPGAVLTIRNSKFGKSRLVPLRHTAAMALLHTGVDTSTIALWLGHASTQATDVYLHADLAVKEKALARTAPPGVETRRYRPGDSLLAFLESL